MYTPLLLIHSWLRWFVLIAGLLAVLRAIGGTNSGRGWAPADARAGLLFITSLDLQFVIGLALYLFFSPTVQAAFTNVAAAMRDSGLRFFLIEHQIGMIAALVFAHIGRARSKRGRSDVARHKSALVFYAVAMILILVSIPWPGMPAGRVLFRLS